MGEEKREFFGGLFLVAVLVAMICSIWLVYQKDKEIMATSRDVVVTVVGKDRGIHRRRPRIVVVRDGNSLITIETRGKWYFEAVPGEQTTVRYSSRYNAYREPYHTGNKEKYFMLFLFVGFVVSVVRVVWLAHYIWIRSRE